MTLTLLTLLAMVAMILLLRVVAWRGVHLAARFLREATASLKDFAGRQDVAEIKGKVATWLPQTVAFLEARLSPSRFLGLPLTLLVVAALYVAALFGGLVEELLEADELVRFDKWLNQQLESLRTDGLVEVFSWITDLGGSPALVAVALTATGLLWAASRMEATLPLWLTILGSQLTTYVGKYVLARDRPDFVTDIAVATPSFPSGHATSAIAVYGFIAYLVARELETSRQRFEVVYWAGVLISLVGFSRVLLGVHYASDVVAGILVGGFWLLVGFALAEDGRET